MVCFSFESHEGNCTHRDKNLGRDDYPTIRRHQGRDRRAAT